MNINRPIGRRDDDPAAAARVFPLVVLDLRGLAGGQFGTLQLTARSADRLELSLVSELVEMDKAQAEKLVRALVLWLERDVVVASAFQDSFEEKGVTRNE